MKYIKEFIDKYPDLKLLDTLTYNSYRTWKRNYTRDYDSISVSEILWLIEDSNLENVKRFYWDAMKQAAKAWTIFHKEIEDHIKLGKLSTTQQFKAYRLSCIKEWFTCLKSEINYSIPFNDIVLTWEVDAEWIISEDSITLDWKTTRKKRAFKSVKQKIQIAFYMKLNSTKRWWLIYLTNWWYEFIELTKEEIIYYTNIVDDLIKYASDLYKKWKVINLNN